MKTLNLTRRDLIKTLGVGTSSLAFGTHAPTMAGSEIFQASQFNDYKALVCIFLLGGNDSFNMVVPISDVEYDLYNTSRQNLAVPRDELLAIQPLVSDGVDYGFHPAMPGCQSLFESGRMSIVANVGALIEPVTKALIEQGQVMLPDQLFSHNSQQQFWMDSRIKPRAPIGWAGRLGDILEPMDKPSPLGMNISIAGNNVWQKGLESTPYVMKSNGIISLTNRLSSQSGSKINRARGKAFDALLQTGHDHLFVKQFAEVQQQARLIDQTLSGIVQDLLPLDTAFNSENPLTAQLNAVTQLIRAGQILGTKRQIFYVGMGGWDTHDDQLENHPLLLGALDEALTTFNTALDELGLADNVTSFTAADFGRTLTSNGDGSDHGWGSVQLIMGGAVKGREMIGKYPRLIAGGDDDIGRSGRIIPTISTDQYSAMLAKWFGAFDADALQAIFPNLKYFSNADLDFT
ncbi:MAG: DUF1501 domain-containing protein [Cellvibrionales bacterium]|nr:DUF1501 domain-containing protein [Cellvibrionales bacterium]